jgi:hypothetical protein
MGEDTPAGPVRAASLESQKECPGRDYQSDQDSAEHHEPGGVEAPGGLFIHPFAFLFVLDPVFTLFLVMLMMLFFMIQDGTSF